MLEHPEIPKETARQRARRIWSNNKLSKEYKNPSSKQQTQPPTRMKSELIKILYNREYDTVKYYLIALRARKRKLLKAKLARIIEGYEDE
jgi:hypothetical protein